jgi:hypothetical protein
MIILDTELKRLVPKDVPPVDNLAVHSDFVRAVIVLHNFKDDMIGGFSSRVFPGLAHSLSSAKMPISMLCKSSAT